MRPVNKLLEDRAIRPSAVGGVLLHEELWKVLVCLNEVSFEFA